MVPGLKACECFGFVPSLHTGGDDAWRSTLGAHRVAEMIASIGTVGKHFAGIIGQSAADAGILQRAEADDLTWKRAVSAPPSSSTGRSARFSVVPPDAAEGALFRPTATELTGDVDKAIYWYRNEPIADYGHCTAAKHRSALFVRFGSYSV